jgi:hypothetical protein
MLVQPGSHALAAVPSLVNFQGVLTETTTGLPITDGPHSVTFRIFDVDTGGTALWQEAKNIDTSGGVFDTLLGSVTPLPSDVFDGTARYLEIQVSPDPAMSPRQRFVSVPYAYHANTADTANSADIANDLNCVGCVNSGELSAGVGAVPQDAIILWSGSVCPTSYTRFAALDGATLRAGDTFSTPVAAGLSDLPAHSHDAGTFQSAEHTHNLWTDVNATGPTQGNGIGPNLTFNAEWKTTHIQPASAGVITGTTGSAGSGTVATVLLCQKD